MWATGLESDQAVVRERKRKTAFYSNIYVVSDPANPANNGKVFLYRYGKKIYDKIMSQMKPEFKDETPIDVTDLWVGANFKLKFSVVDKQRSYEKSGFDTPTPLLDNDEKLEAVYHSLYSLTAFLDPKNFKSYADLEKHLNSVLGTVSEGTPTKVAPQKAVGKVATARAPVADEEDDVVYEKPQPAATKAAQSDDDGDEETLSYFANLAKK